MKHRLQKLIAQAGLCSRREAEHWIQNGRVAVNGIVVTVIGTQADPSTDRITVDGKALILPEESRLIAFYKPRNIMVTRRDPEGRPTVYEYLPPQFQTFKSVGRLDFDSEGLLLFTNDGELQNRLLHPRYHLDKRYRVIVSPPPRPKQLEGLRAGAGAYEPIEARIVGTHSAKAELELVLREGKNRQIRMMCNAVGLNVLTLKRIAIGPWTLGTLKAGEWRAVDASLHIAPSTSSDNRLLK